MPNSTTTSWPAPSRHNCFLLGHGSSRLVPNERDCSHSVLPKSLRPHSHSEWTAGGIPRSRDDQALISSFTYRLRKRFELRVLRQLSARQWQPRQELLLAGDALARKLSQHAAANVPYYRKMFCQLRIDPAALRFPEDWDRLPLLDKDTLRHEYEGLISGSADARNSYVNYSGGSIGTPVKFLTDRTLHKKMAGWLDFVASRAGWKPGELRLELWGNRHRRLPPTVWERVRASLSGTFPIAVYQYNESDLFQWWRTLCSLRPSIIYGYASVLADFAKWLEAERHTPAGIKGIFSSAEVLYPEQRNVIERVFRCKVFNQYGSRETPCVACECPHGGMHLFVDWNRVEFLDSEESDGAKKEIVITPLFNYAQPLLRYRIGDLGRPGSAECPCGRGYPLMELELARSRDLLCNSDGITFFPGFLVRLLDGKKWIRAFQFVQTSENGSRAKYCAGYLPGPGDSRGRPSEGTGDANQAADGR